MEPGWWFFEEERFTQSRKADKNAFTDTILVPVDAGLVLPCMRITMAYREASMACDSPAEFGEAEDYCVGNSEAVSPYETGKHRWCCIPTCSEQFYNIRQQPGYFKPTQHHRRRREKCLQQSLSRGIQHHWQELSGKLNAGYYVGKALEPMSVPATCHWLFGNKEIWLENHRQAIVRGLQSSQCFVFSKYWHCNKLLQLSWVKIHSESCGSFFHQSHCHLLNL